MLRASAAHLPSIGWLVGAITAAVFGGLLWALPHQPAAPWVAAIISTAVGAYVTGAFHEDGLADLADGLGGSYQRERALEIMKDSRIGSFGAMALVLALLGKCALLALLAQVDASLAIGALFGAHVCSRLLPLLLIRSLPHVGDTPQSKSKPLADAISWSALTVGLVWWALGLGALLVWRPSWAWAAGMVACGIAGWRMRSLLQRRLQGFTGDGLGATQQVGELAFYLGVALFAGPWITAL